MSGSFPKFVYTRPTTSPASFWASVAFGPHPHVLWTRGFVCMIDMPAFREMLRLPRTWGDPSLKLPLKAALDTPSTPLLDSLYGQAETD